MNKKIVLVPVGSRETGLGALGNMFGQCAGVQMDRNSCVKESPGTWPCTMYVGKSEF